MSLPEEPPSTGPAQHGEPMHELLLAQALDACIRAERRAAGSAAPIIAQQPEWARDELCRLLALAGWLDKSATNAVMSAEFRVAARERLMQRIGAESGMPPTLLGPHLTTVPSRNGHQRLLSGASSTWLWRGSAVLLAAALALTATLTVSANALPGEPLYSLKQAQEELGVRLASDDQSRALALLSRADARLDETARLLQQGRTDEALLTTQRYDQVVERATTTYVVTIDDTPEAAPAAAHIDTRLSQQQEQLQTMLDTAPEQARSDLRGALVATERSRALVADPRPVERALGRNHGRDALAAAVPTVAAEDVPTVVPTRSPAPQPTPAAVLAENKDEQHASLLAQVPADRGEQGGGRAGDDDKSAGAARGGGGDGAPTARPQVVNAPSNAGRSGSSGSAQPVRSTGGERVDAERNAEQSPEPAVVAKDDRGSDNAAPQANTPPRTRADGRGGGPQPQPQSQPQPQPPPQSQPVERARDEVAPPPVVARPQVVPAQASDGRGTATSGSGTATKQNDGGGASARPQAPAPAVGLAQPDRSGRETGDDARATAPTSPGPANKPVSTSTPTTVRKNTGDDKPNPPPPTNRNAGADKSPTGGGNAGDDHPGH